MESRQSQRKKGKKGTITEIEGWRLDSQRGKGWRVDSQRGRRMESRQSQGEKGEKWTITEIEGWRVDRLVHMVYCIECFIQ